MVPQFQTGGGFGVMLQMAGVGEMLRKIFQVHAGIVQNGPVGHGSMVRGGDSLCRNGNSQYLLRFISGIVQHGKRWESRFQDTMWWIRSMTLTTIWA